MMLDVVDPSTPYAAAARIYADAGWAGVLPLPERKKASPPDGYTGNEGAYPTVEQIDVWVLQRSTGNIGLRLPPDTTGVDVDDYDGKDGATTLQALEAAYGPLPPTWISTSRHDGTSGIRLYRLPAPAKLNDKPGAGIEIIQRHHRYVVCWPSVHPDTGDAYYWITPDGEISDRPPRPDELAELPAAWFAGLQAPKHRSVEGLPFGDEPGARWTRAVEAAFGRAMAELSGGRHDAALHGCAALVRFQSLGYPGAGDALQRLETAFLAAVSDRSSEREAAAEWRRMLEGAAELIRTTPSTIRPYAELVAERRDNFDPASLIATPPSSNGEEGDEPAPGSAPAGRVSPAKIREAFWDARETLDQIRAGARSTLVAPDAYLGGVLARVAWLLPPAVTLPPIIGGTRGSLNLLVALTGSPGAGKTVGVPASRTVIPQRPQDPYGFSCGFSTGQGAIEQYIGVVSELDPQTGKPVKRRVQTRYHGLFIVDEGSALTSLSARDGSIVWETIRSAWSGAELSTPNADEERRRHLPEHGYRFVLVVGLQPSAAAALLGDAALGGPQRFLWLDNDDPGAVRHTEPGLPFDIDNRAEQFTVDPTIVDQIQDERVARLRSEIDVAELDTHRTQLRLRTGALLAAVENRRDVNREDWQLAQMVMEASDATRTSVSGHLAAEHDSTLERRARDAARVAVRVRQAVDRDRTAVAITAAKVAAHIYDERLEGCPEGVGHTTKCLMWVRPAAGSTRREGIAYALDEGWIERSGRRLVAGPNVPDEEADEGADGDV